MLAARIRTDEPVPGVTLHHRPDLLDGHGDPAERLGDWPDCTVAHFHQFDDPRVIDFVRRKSPVLISAHVYAGCTSGVYYFSPGQECVRAHGPGCIPNLIARGCAHTRYPRTLPRKYLNVTRGLAALRMADLVISYSSAVDRHLAANALERRKIVPLFPTLAPPDPPHEAKHRRVLFAGRLEHTKGATVLLQAARELDAEFVICGEGKQLERLRALAAQLAVEDRVRFAGWLEPRELASELAQASVVAMPSLWPEPFGLVGIEALACARPVVASATGGILDWLREDVGLGVRPGDASALARALEELLRDPARARAMGLAGQALVAERFSPQRHVHGLIDAYRSARDTWRSREALG